MKYTLEDMKRNFCETEPNLWKWGDWYITRRIDHFYLIVSSGVEYGPWGCLDEALNHAAGVAF